MTDWIQGLGSAIGSAISTAFGALWEKVSTEIFDLFFRWLYELIFDTIADFFTMIGGMGTELFDLPWVEAYLRLFSVFGWTLFITGLSVAIFDTAIEYQSMGHINIKRQIMPFLLGFLAVNLFTVVPVRLYCFCLSVQNTFMHSLSGIFTAGQSLESNIGAVALGALQIMAPVGGAAFTVIGSALQLFFIIALGYCVVTVFFASVKRGGILLIQIAVGSLHMFSVPSGNTDGLFAWCRQVVALCLTAFLQITLLYIGLLTWQTSMLLGIGVMLAAKEVPMIARQYGLDTSVKVQFSSAVHNTTMAVNLARKVLKA
jgi:hypothetical protein